MIFNHPGYKIYWRLLMSLLLMLAVSSWLHLNNAPTTQSLNHQDTHSHDLANNDLKIFTPDWGIAATLVMMGNPPVAIGDKRIYPVWVDKPKLSVDIIDAGIRGQPNVELLAQLQPDLILDTFFYKETRSVYAPNIPVYEIDFGIKDSNTDQRKTWTPFIQATHKIGTLLKKPEQAQRYIDNSKQRIIKAGQTIRRRIGNKKILVANFWDARELKIDTINSHTTLAAQMMGIDVIDIGSGSQWGKSSIPIHHLYQLPSDTCLIITEPIPTTMKYEISHSPLWQRSPFFRADACIYKISPVWSNGGIEVMVNFAENLAEAVSTQQPNEFSFEYVTQMEGDQ